MKSCAAVMQRCTVITLVKPDVIVPLGITALAALDLLGSHGVVLREGVAQLLAWRGMHLFPLYHPGPRAVVHRPLAKQRSDFMRLSKIVHPVKGMLERKKRRVIDHDLLPSDASTIQHVARVLLDLCGRMTYFKMTKLMYFVDLLALERFGRTLASDIYLRQVDGPWPPSLDRALEAMHGHEVRRFFMRRIPMVAPGPSPRFNIELDDDILGLIVEVSRCYGSMSNAQIKTAAYHTTPMQFILREERKGRNMINKPVLYKDKDIQQLTEAEDR